MKNLLVLFIALLPVLLFSQPDSLKQRHKKNPIYKNFKFQWDDFYSKNSRYTHKESALKTVHYGWAKEPIDKKISPVVFLDGRYGIKVAYCGIKWPFLESVDIKIGDVIFQFKLIDCTRDVTSDANIVETCYFDLPIETFKEIINTEEIKIRVNGKKYFYEYDFDRDVWEDCYFLIEELSKMKE